jgi:ribonuclease HI
MGCYLAMKLAMSTGQKLVCGDSQLVLDFWSRGRVNADTAAKDADLALLVSKTAQLRKMFEKAGGKLQHVPGGINPADLGFHRD